MPTPFVEITQNETPYKDDRSLESYWHMKAVYRSKEEDEDDECFVRKIKILHKEPYVKRSRNPLLPSSLSHIEKAIEYANYIPKLEDDWDGEGAIGIPAQIFTRAKNFIQDYSKSLFEKSSIVLVAPIISPLSDGSIDVLWQTKSNSLLVNVKNSEMDICYYYGVFDIQNLKHDFNGKISTTPIVPFFFDWLKEFKVED
jgi:hypothetical protein